jgi:hypothetical protein
VTEFVGVFIAFSCADFLTMIEDQCAMINRAFGLDSRLCDDGYLLNQVPDDIAESDRTP